VLALLYSGTCNSHKSDFGLKTANQNSFHIQQRSVGWKKRGHGDVFDTLVNTRFSYTRTPVVSVIGEQTIQPKNRLVDAK
jgi:hypothetical protein